MGIVRLSDWQFDPGEKVTLAWLRSPWRESVHRQWRITAIFKRQTGELREVDFPWGLLPWLRMGQIFEDGQPIWNETEGKVFRLSIPDSSTATMHQAIFVPNFSEGLIEDPRNLLEYCVTFQTQQDITIVIPVLECIRAFLVPNKALASGLLEPNFFERVISKNEISLGKLSLGFSKDMPKKILSRTLVFRIARLLYDKSFRAAWNRVYSNRLSESVQENWNASIPLTTVLPSLASEWHVRGVLKEKNFLVQQILEVAPKRSLPFTELEFTHPLIKKREYGEGRRSKRQRKPKAETEHIIESEAVPPENSKTSENLPRLGTPIVERHRLRIRQTGTASVISIRSERDASDETENQGASTQSAGAALKSQSVNLGERGFSGKFPSAEFSLKTPLGIFIATDDGLDDFAEAVRYLDEMHFDVSVTWNVHEFDRETPFAKVAERPRKYALVELRIGELSPCWILEFGRPDKYSISTLIFTLKKSSVDSLEDILKHLLDVALLPQGGWSSKPLKVLKDSIKGFNYRWTKHTDSATEDWGERLYRNAQEVVKRNKG